VVQFDELGCKWVDEGNITHGAKKGNNGVDGLVDSNGRRMPTESDQAPDFTGVAHPDGTQV